MIRKDMDFLNLESECRMSYIFKNVLRDLLYIHTYIHTYIHRVNVW